MDGFEAGPGCQVEPPPHPSHPLSGKESPTILGAGGVGAGGASGLGTRRWGCPSATTPTARSMSCWSCGTTSGAAAGPARRGWWIGRIRGDEKELADFGSFKSFLKTAIRVIRCVFELKREDMLARGETKDNVHVGRRMGIFFCSRIHPYLLTIPTSLAFLAYFFRGETDR